MILLSIGHSGGDVGAVANGRIEFDVCERIGKEVARLANLRTPRVVLVPTNLKLALKDARGKITTPRIDWINKNSSEGDIVIELHMDAASQSANGASVYCAKEYKNVNDTAQALINKYCAETGLKNRGVYNDNQGQHSRLAIIRDTKPLAFLVELGFITNTGDLNLVEKEGVDGVLAMVNYLLGTDVPKEIEKPSTWAMPAFEVAKKFGYSEMNPQEIVGTIRDRDIFVKHPRYKGHIADNKQPITYQERLMMFFKAGDFN